MLLVRAKNSALIVPMWRNQALNVPMWRNKNQGTFMFYVLCYVTCLRWLAWLCSKSRNCQSDNNCVLKMKTAPMKHNDGYAQRDRIALPPCCKHNDGYARCGRAHAEVHRQLQFLRVFQLGVGRGCGGVWPSAFCADNSHAEENPASIIHPLCATSRFRRQI